MSKKNDEHKTPEPFYHESENFSSAYFGKIPESILKQAGGKVDMQLVSSLVAQLTEPAHSENRVKVLSMLRDAQSQELLVGIIRMKEYESKRASLIAAAWETSLDFSNYLEVFTRIAVDGDYTVCLEATTLITENMGTEFNTSQLENSLQLLKEADNQKDTYALLQPVVDLLKNASAV